MMDRRSFLASAVGWFAALFAGRPHQRRPTTTLDGYRLLSEPCVIERGIPIGIVAMAEDTERA